jgi:hypothetical protein
MTYDVVRIAEHIHGHLGWLAAAALIHPAIVLRIRRRRAHLAVAFAVLFPTVVGAVGMWVYGPYRDRIKQSIFMDSPWIGLLFERKEHLAFAAILLSWAGGVAYVMASRGRGERGAVPAAEETLRTLASRAFLAASVLAVIVAVLGTVVASFRTF